MYERGALESLGFSLMLNGSPISMANGLNENGFFKQSVKDMLGITDYRELWVGEVGKPSKVMEKVYGPDAPAQEKLGEAADKLTHAIETRSDDLNKYASVYKSRMQLYSECFHVLGLLRTRGASGWDQASRLQAVPDDTHDDSIHWREPGSPSDYSAMAGQKFKAALQVLGFCTALPGGDEIRGFVRGDSDSKRRKMGHTNTGKLNQDALAALGITSYWELWGGGGKAVERAKALAAAGDVGRVAAARDLVGEGIELFRVARDTSRVRRTHEDMVECLRVCRKELMVAYGGAMAVDGEAPVPQRQTGESASAGAGLGGIAGPEAMDVQP
jgi:hypothetical protein